MRSWTMKEMVSKLLSLPYTVTENRELFLKSPTFDPDLRRRNPAMA